MKSYIITQNTKTMTIEKDIVKQLRKVVQENIMKVGHNHWGIEYDIINISNVLKIGIIIIQRDRGIYCVSEKNKNLNIICLFITLIVFIIN